MIQCPACRITYVQNTLFCTECGLYLLKSEDLGTDPFETDEEEWMDEAGSARRGTPLPGSGPLSIALRIGGPCSETSRSGQGRARAARSRRGRRLRRSERAGELELSLARPIRLGRIDPTQDIYPEVDLTRFLGMEYGVSREHARIMQRGDVVEVEDLASTNGTLLNGKRLAPYLPVPLQDGDLLQLGRLLIEVGLRVRREQTAPMARPVLGAAAV